MGAYNTLKFASRFNPKKVKEEVLFLSLFLTFNYLKKKQQGELAIKKIK